MVQKQKGRDARIAEAFDSYYPLVRTICRNILGNDPGEIEDCSADVFLALYTSGSFDPECGSLKNYLCSIARNKAVDRVRRRASAPRRTSLDDAADTSGCDDVIRTLEDREEAQRLVSMVSSMGAPDREIFILRYWYCEPVSRIAERLGLSAKAVENRLRRGRAALRKQWEAAQ